MFPFACLSNGTGKQQITFAIGLDLLNPAWSPDGSQIVFSMAAPDEDHQRALAIINADGTEARLVISNSVVNDFPSWSPDGTKILFDSNRGGVARIWTMNPDGSDPVSLTQGPLDAAASWSPDGRQIIFVSYRDGNGEVYVMNSDGTEQRNLTNHPASDTWPSLWTPQPTR